MDSTLTITELQQINSLLDTLAADQTIPVDKKSSSIASWRKDTDDIAKEYQKRSAQLTEEFRNKFNSKQRDISSGIESIRRSTT